MSSGTERLGVTNRPEQMQRGTIHETVLSSTKHELYLKSNLYMA